MVRRSGFPDAGVPSPGRRRALLVAAALAVGSCLAPTLPLPPPEMPQIEGPDEAGVTHLSGRVQANAWVYAYNRASEVGHFRATGDDGRYELEIVAQVGDPILMWYTVSGEQSDSLEFEIPEPR